MLRCLEVDRAWSVFAETFLLGQFPKVDFFLIFTLRNREAEIASSLLSRKWQFSEGCMCLL